MPLTRNRLPSSSIGVPTLMLWLPNTTPSAEDGLVGIGGSQHPAIGRQGHEAPLQRDDLLDLNTAVGLVTYHDADLAGLTGRRD